MRPRRLAVALAVVLAAAGRAHAEDLPGPGFGNARSTSSIDSVAGEEDRDAYVESLIAGERLRVSVTGAARGDLLPALTIRGPNGEAGPDSVVRRDGRRRVVPWFDVPSTGRWTIVVAGTGGTEGKYTLSTRIRRLPRRRFPNLPIGGAAGDEALFRFDATDGSRCCMRVRAPRALMPRFRSLVDPSGTDVPGREAATAVEEMVVRRNGAAHVLRDHPLVDGDGTYVATLGIEPGTAGEYDVFLHVQPRGRPRRNRRYSADSDVYLEPRTVPLAGGEGSVVRLAGLNFSRSASAPPRAWFGAAPAPVVAVDEDGGEYVDVRVPAAPAVGAVVPVTVVNPDGQGAVRDAYFRFEAAGLEDLSPTLVPPVSASDDLSAQRAALGDLDGDGARDDVVLVSPGDPAVFLDPEFLGPADDVPVAPDAQTTTPGTIATAGEEDTFSFSLATAGWVVVTSDLPGTLADAALSVRGPATPAVLVAASDAAAAGPVETVRVRLGAGTWFVRVAGVDGATGSYALRVRHHPGSATAPGTRTVRTRLLLGAPDGTLVDETDGNLPQTALYGGYGRSEFSAHAVALGDLDGDGADDIVLGGFAPGYLGDYATYGNAYRDAVGQVLVLRNDGYGTFRQVADDLPPGIGDRLDVYGVDEQSRDVPLLVAYRSVAGFDVGRLPPTSLALGDLDGDGDDDVVAGFAEALAARSAVLDFSKVDASVYPPFVPSGALDEYDGYFYAFNPVYVAATQILLNRIDDGGGLEYTTGLSLPVGEPDQKGPVTLPGYHARDVALGDVDGDDDLDLVLTWDDPTTVSIYGALYPATDPLVAGSPTYGLAFDAPRIATRVLLNDGAGRFTDVTDTWLPQPAAPEFWQAHRVALADLDADGDLDLLLAHRDGIEAYLSRTTEALTATPAAGTTSPGRIAATREVDRFVIDVPERMVLEVLLDLGTLRSGEAILLDAAEATVAEGFGGFGFPGRAYALVEAGTYLVDVKGPGPGEGGATGSYDLRVARVLAPQPVPHVRHALRVLENRGDKHGFADVTTAVLPAVDAAAGDDLRGEALLVTDVNGDGVPDIVVGTREPLTGGTGAAAPSTRLLLGSLAFAFTATSADFLPDPAAESGEASDLLFGDLGGEDVLFLCGERRPRASGGGGYLRVLAPR